MFDRKAFFDAVRVKPFGKALTQSQVDGMNIILDAWDKSGFYDTRWLAYMLATAFHETDRTMQPIREYGRGKGMKYGATYYGRGFVQLTWKANYQKAKDRFGEDLVGNPDLALRPDLAAKIMFSGMTEGWFTGKKLGDYINDSTGCDYKGARRIINGTDKAVTIANYAVAFEKAITGASAQPQVSDQPVIPDTPPPVMPKPVPAAPEAPEAPAPSNATAGVVAGGGGLLAILAGTLGNWWWVALGIAAVALVAGIILIKRK